MIREASKLLLGQSKFVKGRIMTALVFTYTYIFISTSISFAHERMGISVSDTDNYHYETFLMSETDR